MKTSDPDKLDQAQIKNIIFDWGGVIINIDYYATINAFNKLGFDDFKSFYSQGVQNDFFIQFELGRITPDQLRQFLRNELQKDLSDQQINNAWCAMLMDTPLDRIETIRRLKKNHRIFLLSNTNQIHEDIIIRRLNNDLGFDFLSLFEKAYLSHRLGLRKPLGNIYDYVLKDSELKPEETLFIDDTEPNVDASDELGIISFYLNSDLDIVELFKNWK